MSNLKIRAMIAMRRIKQVKKIADLIEAGVIDGTPERVEEIRNGVKEMIKEYEEKFIKADTKVG